MLLLNDDKTPMEFVVYILEHLFGLQRGAATRVMLAAHENGKAVAGVYDRKEAERLAEQVRERMNAEPGGDPAELFAHVYARPTSALRRQRAVLESELEAGAA